MDDSDATDGLLCGAMKHLRQHRAKPNQQLVLTLLYLAKTKPLLFTTNVVTEVGYTRKAVRSWAGLAVNVD